MAGQWGTCLCCCLWVRNGSCQRLLVSEQAFRLLILNAYLKRHHADTITYTLPSTHTHTLSHTLPSTHCLSYTHSVTHSPNTFFLSHTHTPPQTVSQMHTHSLCHKSEMAPLISQEWPKGAGCPWALPRCSPHLTVRSPLSSAG